MPPPFAEVSDHLFAAINERAFPAAAIEIGGRKGVLWRRALGFLTYEPSASLATADTIFDLASLTKVLATTSLAMRAIDDGRLRLEDTVERWIPEWKGNDRSGVTIADLLSHSSGLTAYLPFYRDCTGRIDYQPAICWSAARVRAANAVDLQRPGIHAPGIRSGGRTAAGATVSLERRVPGIPDAGSTRNSDGLQLSSPQSHWDSARREAGGTARRRQRWIRGEGGSSSARSMTNTWALGGVAGHAGLFGTVAAVGAFARAVLATLDGQPVLARTDTMRRFIQPSGVPGSSRALGWDTMLPTSSCGTRLSPTAIGHTGFTGTSLWIDWERDLYVVLLTNRVHPTRENDAMRRVRPQVHDAVVEAFDRSFR